MDSANKKVLLEQLSSDNIDILINTIENLRTEGDISFLPRVLDLIGSVNPALDNIIFKFLSDLKEQSTVDILVNYLKNSTNQQIIYNLLTSFWQSGLDFSLHYSYLIEIFSKSEFMIAFEAFTIIDSYDKTLNSSILTESIEVLNKSIDTISIDKKPLAIALLEKLQSY